MIEKAFGTDCQALYAGIYCQVCLKWTFSVLFGGRGLGGVYDDIQKSEFLITIF